MKILLTITLSLLLFSCDNSVIGFKKSCNAETAKQTVAELAEVKAKIKQIENLVGKNNTYWVQDSLIKDQKNYYRLQLITTIPYSERLLYTFWVEKDNCKQVFLQTEDQHLISYKEVEKQHSQKEQQQKRFPAFFKQFISDIAFRQEHTVEFLKTFTVEKDGSIISTEEELLTLPINELQTYTFTYYLDRVYCKNTENKNTLVFIPIGNDWRISEVWK